MDNKINVGDNLYKIRNKITSSATSDSSDDEFDKEIVSNSNTTAPKELKKALRRRREEFVKTKRDITFRLSEAMTVIPIDIETYEDNCSHLKIAYEKYKELLDKIEELDSSSWSDADMSSQLADAMRTLENSRLEFLRTSVALKKRSIANSSDAVAVQGEGSIIHELNSLSFKQLFRLGFVFLMPLIISIILAAIVISFVYYGTVRL